MRVLLVRPYAELRVVRALQQGLLCLEPLDLEIVAGGLSVECESRILDLSVSKNEKQELLKTIKAFQPEVVGFTAYSSTFHVVQSLAQLVRERLPRACIIVGGAHATLRPQDYAHGAVDVVVRGEGGSKIAGIIEEWEHGTGASRMEGVLFTKDPQFQRKAALPVPAYPPIDQVPAPRRDLVRRDDYFCVWSSTQERFPRTIFPRVAAVRTSVGCPFRCSFCAVHHVMHGRYVQRPPEDVVDELASLDEDFVYFVDDEMFANSRRAMDIAVLLMERGVRKRYASWARSDTIVQHPGLFATWRRAGLDLVYVGFESMAQNDLDGFRKATTSEQNHQAAKVLRQLGIGLHASFVVRPECTADEFHALESWITQLAPAEFTFTVLSPSPGTDLWETHRDRFICDPFRNYDCMHTLLPTQLPLRRFYQHFGRLSALALRKNPFRMNGVLPPWREFLRAVVGGTRYVHALYTIFRDYPSEMWGLAGADLQGQGQEQWSGNDEHR